MKNYMQKAVDEKQSRELKTAPITSYMAKNLITFHPDTQISTVIDSLLHHKISGAPVLDDHGVLCGVIDDKDCLNTLIDSAYYNQPVGDNRVANYMTNVYKTIHVNSDIADVANMFIHSNFKRLMVIDDNGKLVGSISRRDVLRAISEMTVTTY